MKNILWVLLAFSIASITAQAQVPSQSTGQPACTGEGCPEQAPSTSSQIPGVDTPSQRVTQPSIHTPPEAVRSQSQRTGNQRPDEQSSDVNQTVTTDTGSKIPRKSEFQKFVEDSVGHPLPVFGRNLFLEPQRQFLDSSRTAAPSNYVLGPGDQLMIRAWGKIDVDVTATIDRNGQIFLPHVGTLTLAGVRVDRLESFVRAAIARQYKDFELSVTVGQLRTIQVFVVGQAVHPGLHTVSSLSTLINALFESGGPLPSGTLRDIQVKRDGRTITHFDAYAFILNGDTSADVHLLPGDVIDIPVVGPQVAIDGNVNVPGIYEVKRDATVASGLQDAGGITALALTARATLEHVENHRARAMQQIVLDATGEETPLLGGDILRVYTISSEIKGAVALRGDVAYPGFYQWHEGMRISDLIPSAAFLVPRSYYNRQNRLDINSADHPFRSARDLDLGKTGLSDDGSIRDQNQGDQLAHSGQSETDADKLQQQQANYDQRAARPLSGVDPNTPTEPGQAGERETQETRQREAQTPNSVFTHDNEINWNYAVIQRLNHETLTTQLVPFVLRDAINQPASQENKVLQSGDTVVVYSRKDLDLPLELRARFVRIEGLVKSPGEYELTEGETLRDLVKRAGGFTPHAYLYASRLLRESVRVEQEAHMREMLQQASRDVFSPANLSRNSTNQDATFELQLRQAYLQRLANIHATGRIVLQLSAGANGIDDVPEFALKDGDRFIVPEEPNTVEVLGNVYNTGPLRYLPNQKMGAYLDAAGGATREGDRKREFVLRADGTVISRERDHHVQNLQIYPGDAVIVPPILKAPGNAALLLNWAQIVSAFSLSGLAIRALQ